MDQNRRKFSVRDSEDISLGRPKYFGFKKHSETSCIFPSKKRGKERGRDFRRTPAKAGCFDWQRLGRGRSPHQPASEETLSNKPILQRREPNQTSLSHGASGAEPRSAESCGKSRQMKCVRWAVLGGPNPAGLLLDLGNRYQGVLAQGFPKLLRNPGHTGGFI